MGDQIQERMVKFYAKDDKDIVVLCSDSRGSASLTDFFNKKQQEFPQPLQVVG